MTSVNGLHLQVVAVLTLPFWGVGVRFVADPHIPRSDGLVVEFLPLHSVVFRFGGFCPKTFDGSEGCTEQPKERIPTGRGICFHSYCATGMNIMLFYIYCQSIRL